MGETDTKLPDAAQVNKGSNRIQVNNILSAVCLAALSILLAQSGKDFSPWIIGQLGIAIPLLITSSLAYAKLCYRASTECRVWDGLGWFTHSVGYIMILNATALLLFLHKEYQQIAWIFLAATVAVFVLYSVLDIIAKRSRAAEKIYKLAFYLILVAVGSVLPVLGGWVTPS
jgi:hypothetical protein